MITFTEAAAQLYLEESLSGAVGFVRNALGELLSELISDGPALYDELRRSTLPGFVDRLDAETARWKRQLKKRAKEDPGAGYAEPDAAVLRIDNLIIRLMGAAAVKVHQTLSLVLKSPVGPLIHAPIQAGLMFMLLGGGVLMSLPLSVAWSVLRVAERILQQLEELIGEGATMGFILGGATGAAAGAGLGPVGAVAGAGAGAAVGIGVGDAMTSKEG